MSDLPALVVLAATIGGGSAFLAPTPVAPLAEVQSRAFLSDGSGQSRQDMPVSRAVSGAHVIDRAADGMYYVTARVNGAPVTFLVDTGANMMILSHGDAERVGIADAGATRTARTVAGRISIAVAESKRVEIAGQTLRNVPTAVQQGAGTTSLVGLDVLAELGTISFDSRSMVIRPD